MFNSKKKITDTYSSEINNKQYTVPLFASITITLSSVLLLASTLFGKFIPNKKILTPILLIILCFALLCSISFVVLSVIDHNKNQIHNHLPKLLNELETIKPCVNDVFFLLESQMLEEILLQKLHEETNVSNKEKIVEYLKEHETRVNKYHGFISVENEQDSKSIQDLIIEQNNNTYIFLNENHSKRQLNLIYNTLEKLLTLTKKDIDNKMENLSFIEENSDDEIINTMLNIGTRAVYKLKFYLGKQTLNINLLQTFSPDIQEYIEDLELELYQKVWESKPDQNFKHKNLNDLSRYKKRLLFLASASPENRKYIDGQIFNFTDMLSSLENDDSRKIQIPIFKKRLMNELTKNLMTNEVYDLKLDMYMKAYLLKITESNTSEGVYKLDISEIAKLYVQMQTGEKIDTGNINDIILELDLILNSLGNTDPDTQKKTEISTNKKIFTKYIEAKKEKGLKEIFELFEKSLDKTTIDFIDSKQKDLIDKVKNMENPQEEDSNLKNDKQIVLNEFESLLSSQLPSTKLGEADVIHKNQNLENQYNQF